MTGLRIRRPTGQVAWPLILVEGAEKSGKSVVSYQLSSDPRIGRMFVLDVGEGTADEYARLGPYEVIDHNGTYSDMEQQVRYACQEPKVDGKPNVVAIDSGSNLWDLLKDWTNYRARNSRSGRKKLQEDPDAEIDPSMNLWNDARDRWYRVINVIRRSGCVGVLICRARETALVKDGQPVAGKTDYRVEAEKGTPFAVTAQVRMTRPHKATLVAVRSLDVDVPEDGLVLPADNTLGHLLFDLLQCGENTGAPNITHGVVGLSKNEAKQRLLGLVQRLCPELPENDAKATAARMWQEHFDADVQEVAPDRMVEVLDAAAEALESARAIEVAALVAADNPPAEGEGSETTPPVSGPETPTALALHDATVEHVADKAART